MMEGSNVAMKDGFNEAAFWKEAHRILGKHTRQMILKAEDKNDLDSACKKLESALQKLVERYNPPESVKNELDRVFLDRIELTSRVMKAKEKRVDRHWNADMKKVAVMVLNAVGKNKNSVTHIDKLVDDATNTLCEGNFTTEGARRLLGELSSYGCKNLKQLLGMLEDRPSHMEFLQFLVKNGMPKAREGAMKALNSLMPCDMKPLAKVIPLPIAMVARCQPLHPQMKHI